MKPAAVRHWWVVLRRWWEQQQVIQRFWAELGSVVAYTSSDSIRERASSWSVFVLTNWVVEVVTFIVWGTYDT